MNLAEAPWSRYPDALGGECEGRYGRYGNESLGGLLTQRVGPGYSSEPVCLTSLARPGAADTKPADFGLSLQEARVAAGGGLSL